MTALVGAPRGAGRPAFSFRRPGIPLVARILGVSPSPARTQGGGPTTSSRQPARASGRRLACSFRRTTIHPPSLPLLSRTPSGPAGVLVPPADHPAIPNTVLNQRKQQQQAGLKMATRNKLIAFEEAATQIGVLPMLFPLSNVKKMF